MAAGFPGTSPPGTVACYSMHGRQAGRMNLATAEMGIRVECYAGYRGEEEPRAFWLGERRLEVLELVDRWYGSDCRYYRCRADDGDAYVLRHDERTHTWELAAFTAAGAR